MTIQRYRKKPVEIEAMYWSGGAEAASHIIDWVIANNGTARYVDYGEDREWVDNDPAQGYPERILPEHIDIDTLEGTMRAGIGDWIIRGVKGEFYPCKPDIFEASYEVML